MNVTGIATIGAMGFAITGKTAITIATATAGTSADIKGSIKGK